MSWMDPLCACTACRTLFELSKETSFTGKASSTSGWSIQAKCPIPGLAQWVRPPMTNIPWQPCPSITPSVKLVSFRFKNAKKGSNCQCYYWVFLVTLQCPSSTYGGFRSTREYPDDVIFFSRTHPLMKEVVHPVGGHPLLMRVGVPYKMTRLLVDRVEAVDGQHDVLFIGTGACVCACSERHISV